MKFSVIIPTRSRSEYLRACLASVITAAGNAECEVEILVSDNASGDDTADVVGAINHPSVRYRREPTRVSMRANFEAALNDATGTHVLFIGDDDAVLPNGLRALQSVFEKTRANAVNWRLPGYSWPDPVEQYDGHLKLHPQHMSGRLRKKDPEQILSRMLAASFRSYHDGVVTYHGCVSRDLIDRAREKSQGTYFWCSSPDVFAALHNLMVPGLSFWFADLPITLGGASPRSNGRAGQRSSRREENAADNEFQRFIDESAEDPHNGRLPTSCRSLGLITLDALQMALGFQGRTDKLDKDAWKARLEAEIRGTTEAHQLDCQHHARALLGVEIGTSPERVTAPPNGMPKREDALKRWPGSVTLVGGPAMEDVAAAAETLDDICDLGSASGASQSSLANIGRLARIALRARKAALAN